MRTIDLEKIKTASQEQHTKTMQFLYANCDIEIPYPDLAKLPWEVIPVQRPLSNRDPGGAAYRVRSGKHAGAVIIASAGLYEDEQLWYHASISRKGSTPDYADLAFLKEHFIGEDRWAIQVFVPKDEHVNIHGHALHLWHCITAERPFPRFDRGVGSI